MHTNEPTPVIEWRQLAYSGMVNFGAVKHSSLWRMEVVSGFSFSFFFSFFFYNNQIRVFCLVNCSVYILIFWDIERGKGRSVVLFWERMAGIGKFRPQLIELTSFKPKLLIRFIMNKTC